MTRYYGNCCEAVAMLLFLLIEQIKDWLLRRRLHEA